MKTVEIHTHLLNPSVRFDRLFHRISAHFFGRSLGADPAQRMARPYETYVSSMARAIRESRQVEMICLFGVDGRLDEQGREIDRDKTVGATTDDDGRGGPPPFRSVHPLPLHQSPAAGCPGPDQKGC